MRGLLLCAIVALALVGQARADYGGSSGSFVLLDQNAVALTKLIASTNGSRVILGPLGQMSGVVGEGRCWQMNVTILPQTLAVLQEVLAVANATQLQVFVGLLGTAWGSLPESDALCGPWYANESLTAALQIAPMMNAFGPSLDWHWSIPQEPAIDAMPLTNPDCQQDGETTFFQILTQDLFDFFPQQMTLAGPFFTTQQSPQRQAQALAQFAQCVPQLSIVAVQDGVGTMGTPPSATAAYFQAFWAYFNEAPQLLWANVETFLPQAQFCQAAPLSRIEQQVASVKNYATGIVNFWAYNLPGAPTCISPIPPSSASQRR